MPGRPDCRSGQQVRDIGAPAREEIVDAEDFRPRLEQALAQEGTDESGAAGDENAGNVMHHSGVRAFCRTVKRASAHGLPLVEIVQCAARNDFVALLDLMGFKIRLAFDIAINTPEVLVAGL